MKKLVKISEVAVALNVCEETVRNYRRDRWEQGKQYQKFTNSERATYRYDLEAILAGNYVQDLSKLNGQLVRMPLQKRSQA